jgi:HrpA-like RNA helicase
MINFRGSFFKQGIKYVIDTGMIKSKIYTPENNLEVLKVHKISKSQAWQRTGRAGRESPGVCYRLYTDTDFESMPHSAVPEILRSNLASVALQLIALGNEIAPNKSGICNNFLARTLKRSLALAFLEAKENDYEKS